MNTLATLGPDLHTAIFSSASQRLLSSPCYPS
jgi:hypothetical protein